MAQPSISVPLGQFDLLQSVLESYYLNRPLPPSKPVGLPVSNPTRSFWIDSPGANPLATEGSQGDLTQDADTCIIGSGITGVSAAYHLAGLLGEHSDRTTNRTVVILEAREFCSGATGRNGGHLTPSVFLDFSRREQLYGTQEAVKSYDLENYTAASLLRIIRDSNEDPSLSGNETEVDLVNGRHVTLFFTETEEEIAKRDFEAGKAAGLSHLDEVIWIDRETMHKTRGTSFPGVEMPGHNLWPLKLVTRLFKLAERGSQNVQVNLHTRTPVTSIVSNGEGRRYDVTTPRGNVKCDYVLHATNGYVNHLISPDETGIQVVPTRGQIIGTRAGATGDRVGKTSWDANEGFEYWFPRPTHKEGEKPLVILGGGREVSGPKFELYETNDGEMNLEVDVALKKFLPGLFPEIFPGTPIVEWEWTGIMGYTKSGDPFVGPVDAANSTSTGQYVAAGYTGHGMPRGYACGEVIAGMVAAEVLQRPWKQPEWLPDHYLTSGKHSIL